MTRHYTHSTKEDRYNRLVKRIESLETAHNKRYERIGKLREKAQNYVNQLKTKEVPTQTNG